MTHITGKRKNQAKETARDRGQMLSLTEKYFKTAIINMFTEPKETIIKVVKKGVKDNVASNREYQQKHRNYI